MNNAHLHTFQVRRPSPTTSAERMRHLRRRNPGYDRQYKARRKAEAIARRAAIETLAREAVSATAPALAEVTLEVEHRPLLLLPAPVQDPMMESLARLAESLKSHSAGQPMPVTTVQPPSQSRSRAA